MHGIMSFFFGESSLLLNFAPCVSPRDSAFDTQQNLKHTDFKKNIYSIAYVMNLKKFLIFCEILVPNIANISSNTGENYLCYKFEVIFLQYFETQYPLLFVNRSYMFILFEFKHVYLNVFKYHGLQKQYDNLMSNMINGVREAKQ